MNKTIIFLLIILVFVSIACSINVPFGTFETGDVEIFDFSAPAPDGESPQNIIIEMAAGKLNLSGGSEGLIDGTIEYNIPEIEPVIDSNNDHYAVIQDIQFDTARFPVGKIVNKWDLILGTSPIDLTINAGAYDGKLDLSEIPILTLEISDGASNSDISFNLPNPVVMESFEYRTGASNISIYGLANANLEQLVFEGGAGSYTLDFSGELQRDCNASVTSGVSNLKVVIPEGVRSQVNIVGGLNNIYLTGTWTVDDRTYETTGEGSLITINVDMGVGSLELINQ